MSTPCCKRARGEAYFLALCIACILLTLGNLPAQSTPVLAGPAAEFVELTAEIEILSWPGGLGSEEGPRPQSFQIRAVVGKDRWAIGELFSGQTNYYLFDGSRIIEWACSFGTNGSTGNRSISSSKSSDGNPSATVRASDHLDMVARIAWLAFCSAATLNNPEHKLYPPWDFWKEYLDPSKFTEKVDRFKDALGLPKSLLIISGEHQPVVDYRVSGTTNIAGSLFPKSFYLLEYNPSGTKGWMLGLLAHGKLRTIAPAAVPVPSGTTVQADYESEVRREAEIRQAYEGLWLGRPLSGPINP
jgi:hypothetical protein